MRQRPSFASLIAAALLATAGIGQAFAHDERVISSLTQDNPWGAYSR